MEGVRAQLLHFEVRGTNDHPRVAKVSDPGFFMTIIKTHCWVTPASSDSVSLGWGLRICIFNKFSVDTVAAAGLGPVV